MSQHNQIATGVAPLRALRIATGISEAEEGVTRLSETLTPTCDIWEYEDWAFLRRERLCANRGSAAAVAANLSAIALRNPLASGILVTIEAASVRAGAGGTSVLSQVMASTSVTGLSDATNGAQNMRDTRWTLTRPQVIMSAGSNLGGIITVPADEVIPAASTYASFQNLPVILHPGFSWVIEDQTINTLIVGVFKWRERLALPSELIVA